MSLSRLVKRVATVDISAACRAGGVSFEPFTDAHLTIPMSTGEY